MMNLFVVVCCVLVVAAASPIYFAPVTSLSGQYSGLLPVSLYNYRGPFSLAPGQPANVLAADGRPLDTLDVNLDRSAHLVAKALDNGHVLKKRSVTRLAVVPGTVGFAAAVASGNVGISTPIANGLPGVAATLATNPIGLSTPLAAESFGVINPFAIGLSTPVVSSPLAVSSPVGPGSIGFSTFPIPSVRTF